MFQNQLAWLTYHLDDSSSEAEGDLEVEAEDAAKSKESREASPQPRIQ